MQRIIDTNVVIEAGNINPTTKQEAKCAKACVDFLDGFMKAEDAEIVLDADYVILGQYERNLKNKQRLFFATPFWTKLQSKNGQPCMSKMDIIAGGLLTT